MYRFAFFLVALTGCASSNDDAAAGSESSGGGSDSHEGAGAAGQPSAGVGGTAGHASSGIVSGTGGQAGHGAAGQGGSSNGTAGMSQAGGGGHGDDGGAPPVVIRACPSGAAAVGTWVQITPPQIPIDDTSVGMVSVSVDPLDPATVYTSGGHKACCGNGSDGVFKSTDCGATWVKWNTGTNGDKLDQGYVWGTGIVINPHDSKIMYAESGYGAEGLWKSTDGGVSWVQLFTPETKIPDIVQYNFTQDLAMDPTDSNHLVVSFHADCAKPYAPMCMADSRDGGATWRIFNGPPSIPSWTEGGGVIALGEHSFLYVAFIGVYYTADDGSKWEKVADSGASEVYKSPTDGKMYIGSGRDVLTSTDGHTWTSIPGSPAATAVIGDGKTIFASFGNDYTGQPFHSASESDLSTWTNVKTPQIKQGVSWFSYDAQHHILYAANLRGGLWRTVTQ